LCLAGVIVVSTILLLSDAARAGGSPLRWDKAAYVPGETAVAEGGFGKGCCDRGVPSDGPFYVYLYDPDDAREQPPLPEGAIRVGTLEITEGGYPWFGRVEFVVPDLPPGQYYPTHCNDPCTTLLGDITHDTFVIAETPVEARTIGRFERIERQLFNRTIPLRGVRPRLDGLARRVRSLERKVSDIQMKMQREAQVAPTTDSSAASGPGAPMLLGVLLLGGIVGALLRPDRYRLGLQPDPAPRGLRLLRRRQQDRAGVPLN
jgi:hypothetical protein